MRHILFTALILSMTGCGIFASDETKDEGGNGNPAADPTTPDLVIQLLERALGEQDGELYEQLLHGSYEFQFASNEIPLSQTLDGRWNRSRDLSSMTTLLSGEPSLEGEVLQSIDVSLSEKSLIWDDDVEPEFEGSRRRTYTIQMDVWLSGGNLHLVRGDQEFYVLEIDDHWELLFWRDGGAPFEKGTAVTSVGELKSFY